MWTVAESTLKCYQKGYHFMSVHTFTDKEMYLKEYYLPHLLKKKTKKA